MGQENAKRNRETQRDAFVEKGVEDWAVDAKETKRLKVTHGAACFRSCVGGQAGRASSQHTGGHLCSTLGSVPRSEKRPHFGLISTATGMRRRAVLGMVGASGAASLRAQDGHRAHGMVTSGMSSAAVAVVGRADPLRLTV